MILLDSSAVIAYLYADDALHATAVAAVEGVVREGASLAISAVTWTELLNGARVTGDEQDAARSFVRDFGIAILPVDAPVGERAADLQGAYARRGRRHDRPNLRTPDALILATADVHGDIDTVIGGDRKWTRVPGVRATIQFLGPHSG